MQILIDFIMAQTNTKTTTVINYLIKDIIRKYGSASIKYVLAQPELRWMTPESIIGDSQLATDRYVLLGDKYLSCKKALLTCFKVKNVSPLNELKLGVDEAPFLCLALYHNVTLLYKNLDNLTAQIADIFSPYIIENFRKQQDMMKPLLENSFTNLFKVSEDNWNYVDFSQLLVQIKYSILFSKSDVIKPLQELIKSPEKTSEKYLPTMPQDNLYDVKMALSQTNGTERSRFYTCPNGHIYVIGDCGRPWVLSKCKECGAEIGGESHRLVDKNRIIDDTIQDKTMKGYCITDDPSNLVDAPSDIRLLNKVAFCLERFFINACMYLGCGDFGQSVEFVKGSMAHQVPCVKDFFLSI